MSERDIKVLKSILGYAEEILEFIRDCKNKEDFINDPKTRSACSLNLFQIGELAKQQLSDEARGQIKDIPWKKIYGLRNRIGHGYEGINFTIIWDTVTNDIPELIERLSVFLKSLN